MKRKTPITAATHNRMDYTEFNNLYLNGLFRDSYEAEMNFAIYKKIKNVWGKLASLEKDEQRLFVYLKQAATLKTVLSLAKLYDKKNKKYPTRCIESLFEELEKSDFEIQNNYVDQLNWDKFSKSNTLVIKTIFNGDEPNAKEFIPYFTDSPLDVSHLTPGFYMIQMHRDGHKMTSRKLIKN